MIHALRESHSLVCPTCRTALVPLDDDPAVECPHCRVGWPVVDGVLDFLSPISPRNRD